MGLAEVAGLAAERFAFNQSELPPRRMPATDRPAGPPRQCSLTEVSQVFWNWRQFLVQPAIGIRLASGSGYGLDKTKARIRPLELAKAALQLSTQVTRPDAP